MIHECRESVILVLRLINIIYLSGSASDPASDHRSSGLRDGRNSKIKVILNRITLLQLRRRELPTPAKLLAFALFFSWNTQAR